MSEPSKPGTVMGVDAPGPRLTHAAIWLAVRLVGLPLLLTLGVIDVAIWAIGWFGWGVCLGFWCYF